MKGGKKGDREKKRKKKGRNLLLPLQTNIRPEKRDSAISHKRKKGGSSLIAGKEEG